MTSTLTWFKLIWYGAYMLNGGQLLAAFVVTDGELAALAPMATVAGMLGLFVVMKFPHICLNARARSGPMFGAAGPKYPLTSAPCKAGSTENWYLYEVLPKSL